MLIETALMCLALNTYHEAKNQSMIGQVATAQVVMNRVADSRYPNTVCEVVKQGPKYKGSDVPVRHKCQFSWFCDGKSDEPRKDSKEWRMAQEYARIVLSGRIVLDVTEGATHYHATYVKPSWARTKTRTTRIESHIFYRWEK
jgi:N-acetylmuramoyl-L-alanine amidase